MDFKLIGRPQSVMSYLMLQDYGGWLQKGDIIVKDTESRWIRISTPIKPCGFYDRYQINDFIRNGLIQPVNLEDYPNLYPHYCKEVIKIINQSV